MLLLCFNLELGLSFCHCGNFHGNVFLRFFWGVAGVWMSWSEVCV